VARIQVGSRVQCGVYRDRKLGTKEGRSCNGGSIEMSGPVVTDTKRNRLVVFSGGSAAVSLHSSSNHACMDSTSMSVKSCVRPTLREARTDQSLE